MCILTSKLPTQLVRRMDQILNAITLPLNFAFVPKMPRQLHP